MIHVPVEQPLPVVRVGEIQNQENAQRWLVEGLWGASSVGVIGGAPKCAKTWLGLDMALSVATGTACLGKYAVPEPGPVLVYLAEDALLVVRERVAGMARHRGLDLAGVAMNVRQPNHVLANEIAGHKAERRPRAGEEWLAATKYDGAEVKPILINKTKVG